MKIQGKWKKMGMIGGVGNHKPDGLILTTTTFFLTEMEFELLLGHMKEELCKITKNIQVAIKGFSC